MKARVKTFEQIRKTLDHAVTCYGISFIPPMERYYGKIIDVKPAGVNDFEGEGFWWCREWLEFDCDSPIEAIIFKDKTTTIIGRDGHKYTATCAENDEWDYEKGAMAAAMRMPCKVYYKDIAPYLQH